MARWRQQAALWELDPVWESGRHSRGTLEFIGGSYLAASPQISYRRLLETLAAAGWRVRAWSYIPGFDHQDQANAAWRAFRRARVDDSSSSTLRVGHSLGCKLHLLAPDGGRGCSGLAALSFNNFSAERSIPLFSDLSQQLGFRSEFSPSPQQTLQQVARTYQQPRNLLVRYLRDQLDQSNRLLAVLSHRPNDRSELIEQAGDHLTPASAGLRQQLLGEWASDGTKMERIQHLAGIIDTWSESLG